MTQPIHSWRQFFLAMAGALLFASTVMGQAQPTPPPSAPAKDQSPAKPAGKKGAPAAPLSGPNGEIYVHAFHADKLGSLECSLCHTAVKDGSVELQRPGHDQCAT